MENKGITRNPAYQFISTDTDEIVAGLIQGYELLMQSTVRPASPEMQFIRWVAHVILQERVLNNWTGNQNIPSRADKVRPLTDQVFVEDAEIVPQLARVNSVTILNGGYEDE